MKYQNIFLDELVNEVIPFWENFSIDKNEITKQQTLKIYTDGNFSKDELAKLKWVKGNNKVEIIYNNQLLRIPGEYNVTAEMLNQMKSLVGVKKIDFLE